MRFLSLLIFTLATALVCDEPPYPLWDGQESVAAYAKKVNLPPTQSLDLGNGVKLELVLIPAGTFIMGTPEPEKPIVGQAMVGVSVAAFFIIMVFMLIRARRKRTRLQFSMAIMLVLTFVASIGVWGGVRWNEALKHVDVSSDEFPAHQVTLTQPFYMGKYEVTQEEYQAVIGANPSLFKGNKNPVETVSWYDAQAFCQKLSEPLKQSIRLPTEAEWEYACRAGTTSVFYSGQTIADLARVAWYWDNSGYKTHEVGQKEANAFGLYDTLGNVFEWCSDWYGGYHAGAVKDPIGSDTGSSRVLRGGYFGFAPSCYRPVGRLSGTPNEGDDTLGFRVVLQVPPKSPNP